MPCPAKELGVIELFVAVDDSRTKNGSALLDDGARLLVARSGTACRAPTGKMRKCDKERCREVLQAIAIQLRCCVGTGTIACATETLLLVVDERLTGIETLGVLLERAAIGGERPTFSRDPQLAPADSNGCARASAGFDY
jgi:hypothetical protein